jgi:hypothetical protein
MSFQFYGNGKAGEVFIEDQRPDGSVVLLVCTQQAARASGAVGRGPAPGLGGDGEIGVVSSSSADGNAYPGLREARLVDRRLPKVHVDTSNLPRGIQRFAQSLFLQKAVEAAETGKREVVLANEEDAVSWGYLGAAEAERLAQPSAPAVSKEGERATGNKRS